MNQKRKPFVREHGVWGEHKKVACLTCGYETDSASAGKANPSRGMPHEGALGVCLNCGATEIYTGHGLQRRPPTEAEQQEIDTDLQVAEMVRVIKYRGPFR